MTAVMSLKAKRKLLRLLTTLDRALDLMESSDIRDLVDGWRGSMNIRDNIREFVDWQSRKLPS